MQGFLVVSTGKNVDNSNVTGVETIQWGLLYYPSVMTGVIENISHSTAKCTGAPSSIYRQW
jgi:hypothetical protein